MVSYYIILLYFILFNRFAHSAGPGRRAVGLGPGNQERQERENQDELEREMEGQGPWLGSNTAWDVGPANFPEF